MDKKNLDTEPAVKQFFYYLIHVSSVRRDSLGQLNSAVVRCPEPYNRFLDKCFILKRHENQQFFSGTCDKMSTVIVLHDFQNAVSVIPF